MKAENFNKDWKFWEDRDSFALVWSVPENAKSVDLPHDAMMERLPHEDSANGTNTGFYDGGNYVYEKKLFVSEEQRNEHLVLAFGGVYMNALVYVNEQEAGRELNGYTEFFVSLDDYLRYGAGGPKLYAKEQPLVSGFGHLSECIHSFLRQDLYPAPGRPDLYRSHRRRPGHGPRGNGYY